MAVVARRMPAAPAASDIATFGASIGVCVLGSRFPRPGSARPPICRDRARRQQTQPGLWPAVAPPARARHDVVPRVSGLPRRRARDLRRSIKFVNAISTNLTKFFREIHHFEHLRTHVAVPFSRTGNRGMDRRLRIWSAGCSTGEEAYTVAVVLQREISDVATRDVRILAYRHRYRRARQGGARRISGEFDRGRAAIIPAVLSGERG